MEELQKKLFWLAIIFPGFLTLAIIGSISDVGDGELSLTLYSLGLTFLDVIIAFFITAGIVGFLDLCRFKLGTVGRTTVFLLMLLVVSVAAGIWIGVQSERGSFFDAIRKMPYLDFDTLNKRSSVRPLTFILRQNSGGLLDLDGDGRPGDKVGEAYLRVYLDDGIVYEGWPEYYSSEETEIYLSPACRITDADSAAKATKVAGPGAFIRESEIKHAILLDRNSSPCWQAYFPTEVPKPRPRSRKTAR